MNLLRKQCWNGLINRAQSYGFQLRVLIQMVHKKMDLVKIKSRHNKYNS